MIALPNRSRTATGPAVLLGTAVGLIVVSMYLVVGSVVADWSISEFFANLSVSYVEPVVSLSALAVAIIGIPVAAFLRFNLIAPLVVLVLSILGLVTLSAVQGALSLQTLSDLAIFALLLFPNYFVLYGVLGGSEYLLRRKAQSR